LLLVLVQVGIADTNVIIDCSIHRLWLRVPERIAFKVAVQTYRALTLRSICNSSRAPPISLASRHRLRSSVADSQFVPAVRLSTVGRRAFPVAGARIIWKDLPSDVTSTHRRRSYLTRLEMHLFRYSYAGLSYCFSHAFAVWSL